MIITSEYY